MSMTGVPGVIPLIGMRAIGIHAVPEAEWMLPDGTVGSAAVPVFGVPLSTAMAGDAVAQQQKALFSEGCYCK